MNNENYEEKMHNHIKNNIYLSDEQINILNKYHFNYQKYNDIGELIFDIENYLNSKYEPELDNLSFYLSEFNYYHNTNK